MNKSEIFLQAISNNTATELEADVIGALILEGDNVAEIRGLITPDVFTDPTHRKIYDAMLRINSRGDTPDLSTIHTELPDVPVLNLTGLMQRVGSAVQLTQHAMMLQDYANKRAMAEYGVRLIQQTTDRTRSSSEIAQWMRGNLDTIGTADAHVRLLGSVLDECFKRLEQRCKDYQAGIPAGVTTGLRHLDKATNGGWRGGQLVILAGRPAMGKSAIALLFAMRSAEQGSSVCYFSAEMSRVELADRMLLSESGADGDAYKQGYTQSDDWGKLEQAMEQIKQFPIALCDTPNNTMANIRSICQLMKNKDRCGLVIIDYLQLLDSDKSKKNDNREREVANMSREAKKIAIDLDVPVILLSQLNRDIEKRQDRTPQLSDLRESGAIEQDADIVIFVDRPEVYDVDTIETAKYGVISSKNAGRLIIAKQRDGRIGNIYFSHDGAMRQITDYAPEPVTPY